MQQETPGDAPEGPTYVNVAGRRFRVPGSRRARITAGTLCVAGGLLGFLPVLGFWMIPLGLLILSVDLPAVRRVRRRMEVWTGRRLAGWRGRSQGEGSPRRHPSTSTADDDAA